jgi:sugar phosphate permease
MLASMMVTGAVDIIALYLPALGVKRGIPAATIGILLSLQSVASMISRVFLSKLVKKLGRSELITLSTVLAAITIGIFIFPLSLPVIAVALFLVGICLGIGQPLTMTIISITVPPASRGMWLAIRLVANRFGQSAVPGAIGLLAAPFGVSGVFFATSLSLALVSGASRYTLPKGQK